MIDNVPQPTTSIDWPNLTFAAHGVSDSDLGETFAEAKVNGHVQSVWKDGSWGPFTFVKESFLQMSVMAPALNYGQQCFEGLKAFRCKDGHIRVFRPIENARRMAHSAEMIAIPPVSEDDFIEGVKLAILRNAEYVPPYETGQSLYIRPLLLGSGLQLALLPPNEFTFVIAVTPVANLYSATGAKPIDALIVEDFDRSAPYGTGSAKLGGNYAPVFQHALKAKKAGFPITLHLDSKTRSHVDEFSTSNFIALKLLPDNRNLLVVPESPSILKSITTKSVIELSKSFGWSVEVRPVPVEEIASFSEIMSAGTAAVLTPIKSVTYRGKKLTELSDVAGPGCIRLLQHLRGIQTGDAQDEFGWMTLVV